MATRSQKPRMPRKQMEMATARVSPSRRLFPRSHLLRQMPSPISPVRRGISVEELEKMSVDAYGVKVEHLSQKDASSLIRQLQQSS